MSRDNVFLITIQVVAFTAAILLTFMVLNFLSSMDYEEEQRQQSEYCEKVKLWKADSHLPKAERRGWPDFKHIYDKECK